MIFLLDLDNTLFDATHRLSLIKGEKKDWEAFFQAAKDDTPMWPTITIARALRGPSNILIAVTGRPERIRGITVEQLTKYRIPVLSLYMRGDKDHRPDYVVKEEVLDKHVIPVYGEIDARYAAFDDSPEVVAMYRRRGILTYDLGRE